MLFEKVISVLLFLSKAESLIPILIQEYIVSEFSAILNPK